MKFAIVDDKKVEATPKVKGLCPNCRSELIARCGSVKVWHWAHKGNPSCDPWWENETEWHRAWKEQFPVDWQEVVHSAENGEKHIADVKTDQGWVLEFQHSYLKPEERVAREAFYRKLVWVVDGARRKRDRTQFLNAWKVGVPVGANSPVRRVFSDECTLLREWAGSQAPVFLDFNDGPMLLWLLSKRLDGPVYVAPFPRANFIEILRGGATKQARDFDEFVKDISKLVADYEAHLRAQASKQAMQPLRGFENYMARRAMHRRRF